MRSYQKTWRKRRMGRPSACGARSESGFTYDAGQIDQTHANSEVPHISVKNFLISSRFLHFFILIIIKSPRPQPYVKAPKLKNTKYYALPGMSCLWIRPTHWRSGRRKRYIKSPTICSPYLTPNSVNVWRSDYGGAMWNHQKLLQQVYVDVGRMVSLLMAQSRENGNMTLGSQTCPRHFHAGFCHYVRLPLTFLVNKIQILLLKEVGIPREVKAPESRIQNCYVLPVCGLGVSCRVCESNGTAGARITRRDIWTLPYSHSSPYKVPLPHWKPPSRGMWNHLKRAADQIMRLRTEWAAHQIVFNGGGMNKNTKMNNCDTACALRHGLPI